MTEVMATRTDRPGDRHRPAHCLADEGAGGIGWIFAHLIDGTQAEYVRVPFAELRLPGAPRRHPRRYSEQGRSTI